LDFELEQYLHIAREREDAYPFLIDIEDSNNLAIEIVVYVYY